MSWFAAYIALAWCIRVLMVPTILRRQIAPGASVAWLGIIFLHPYIGLSLYMMVGETRLGPGQIERHRELVAEYRKPARGLHLKYHAARDQLPPQCEPMILQTEKISGLPVLCGNRFEFIQSATTLAERMIADIDSAKSRVHLLYYMFVNDDIGGSVARAMERAAKRGIQCRVLADAVASRSFFHRHGLANQLKEAGVEVAAALPAAPIQRRLPRMDLRNHRKLAVIDNHIAYAGSHNLINPDYGGRRGEPWIDVTGRFTGPIADHMGAVFAEDWTFETAKAIELHASDDPGAEAGIAMQIAPTGPMTHSETYRRVLLAALQTARKRVILTTPYFVPDEPTLVAMMMAADRGVDVSLVLPKTPDHIFTACAGRAHFAKLLDAGVSIYLYRPGLIHSKTTTIDDLFAIIGSANIDVRSFNLNFELSVLLYGKEATDQLRAIQTAYLNDSDRLEAKVWAKRSIIRRYADNAITLLSPLL